MKRRVAMPLCGLLLAGSTAWAQALDSSKPPRPAPPESQATALASQTDSLDVRLDVPESYSRSRTCPLIQAESNTICERDGLVLKDSELAEGPPTSTHDVTLSGRKLTVVSGAVGSRCVKTGLKGRGTAQDLHLSLGVIGGPRYFCRPTELQISLPVELVPRASSATDARSRKSH
jgi:hypothetical protein